MRHCTQPGEVPVQCDARTAIALKGWRSLALAFFVSAAGTALAAPMDVYRGTLGGSQVVMELGQPQADGVREGRYFYLRHGVDIPLKGQLKALAEAQLLTPELMEALGNDTPLFTDAKQRAVLWSLEQQGDSLSGEWVDGVHGKKLPLSLRHIAHYDPEKIAPKGVEAVTLAIVQGSGSGVSGDVVISEQTTPYDYLRVAKQALEQGKEVVIAKDLAWRPVRDARTKFWYPRLSRHPDAKILAQTNAMLEQRHWGMSLAALGCRASIYLNYGPAAGSLGNYENEEIKVTYLSRALMSGVESGSTDCGGAHPNNHYDPFVLDLLRGGYMDFTRLLKGAKYGEYKLEYSDRFSRFLDKAVRKHSEDDKECTDLLPQYMALMFDKPDKMSFVISGIGHAMGVCLGSGVSVPFKELKPYIKPGAERYLQP
ncbi:MAG: hypothetical protein LBJ15_24940 [Comamonas sp.]|jgi:hypothetical protein|uniref:hypothetical protein n=1 Tax=Comamonas sp. TaxID=34028 RepID=UPI00282410F3|nr:hypothetical protein [Comamonas sp.]MDR0217232.1 hypothetical protein [Comamonas sp.]